MNFLLFGTHKETKVLTNTIDAVKFTPSHHKPGSMKFTVNGKKNHDSALYFYGSQEQSDALALYDEPSHLIQNMKQSITLNNGVELPLLGFGTFQPTASQGLGISDEAVEDAVFTALKAGYHLIDTAAFYQTEAAVGCALRRAGYRPRRYFRYVQALGERYELRRCAPRVRVWIISTCILFTIR